MQGLKVKSGGHDSDRPISHSLRGRKQIAHKSLQIGDLPYEVLGGENCGRFRVYPGQVGILPLHLLGPSTSSLPAQGGALPTFALQGWGEIDRLVVHALY
jgi:hypothetical protein